MKLFLSNIDNEGTAYFGIASFITSHINNQIFDLFLIKIRENAIDETIITDPTRFQAFIDESIAENLRGAHVAYAQLLAFTATLSFELWFVFIARNDNQTAVLKSKPFKK